MGKRKIGVVGLGYVGLPLAAEFGKSQTVIGYDISEERIEQLKLFDDRTNEVSRDQLASASYLRLTSEPADLSDCDTYIITVPTPIDSAKRPNLEPLRSASRLVGELLKQDDIVIFESTVFPGCTEEICVPVLEDASGLVINEHIFCG